jgi:probable F420-dependent oxidoreductase
VRFTLEYPTEHGPYAAEFLTPEVLARFAAEAEQAGFDAVAFSEHPAPSRRWADSGGHDTLDPMIALTWCAAATTRLRLMPHLLVLPYHRPLQLTKTLMTLDLLSRGRLVLAAGTGYLRSEFAALGVDFDERNALFDEAVAALDAAWVGQPYSFAGQHFHAVDQLLKPRPYSTERPPLWLGGNSALTRRRVVRYGQGWSPIIAPDDSGTFASTVRTPVFTSLDELATAVTDLHGQLDAVGRDRDEVTVQTVSPHELSATGDDAAEIRESCRRYAAAGVDSLVVRVDVSSAEEAVEAMRAWGRDVIAVGASR